MRNKAGRITLPAMLADTTDAKRRWAEANEIEVPEGFRGLPMRFETEQQSARGASTMIRDVAKARDYYWSLLEEAKGQETAEQDRIAQAKRGDTSDLYRGAYTENGELLVDTIAEDEYNENANLHRQIQLGKVRYKEVMRDANRANAEEFFERGHLSKFNSVVVGKTRYMYMNFSDQNVGDGVNMIVTDTARVGTTKEQGLLKEAAKINGAGRNTETSRNKGHALRETHPAGGEAGRIKEDRRFSRAGREVLGISQSESVGYTTGTRRGNGPAGTNDPADAGRSADHPRDGRGEHAVSIGHAATNESTDTGAFSLRETPWGIRESRRTFPEREATFPEREATFPAREARPALERAREILGSTQERYEDGRKIPTGKEVAQLLAGGLHANRSWGLKDVVRNIDAFAGKNTEVRNRLEEMIERPFNEAGGAYARNLKARTTAFVETMKELDIRTEQDSAAVQRWGEGVRQNQYGELVEYTLADLQRECPDNWRNVQRAAEVCRGIYEGYVDELNAMLEQIYPNVIEHAETDAKKRPAGAGRLMSESDLFDLAGCANLFESSSDFLCVFLGDAFLDSLGGVVDDFLGFLEAEAGLLADDLDDLDLLGADVLQDDVELGLLFRCFCGGGGACNCDCGRRCGNAKLLFERLHELSKLENGHRFDISNQLFLIHDEILL